MTTVRAHSEGRAQGLTATAWASLCASFLGAGFRVDLPGGMERMEAVAYELDRVRRIADLVGASVAEVDWQAAIAEHADVEIELVGGWPRSYRETLPMWLVARVVRDPPIATAALLPVPYASGPSRGLPTFSRLDDAVSLPEWADCGLWGDLDGRIVTSTAGPVIAHRADGTWATGTDTRTWLGARTASARGATADLAIDDLTTVRSLEIIRRAHGAVAVSYLTAAAT